MIQVALVFLVTMAIFKERGYLAPALGMFAVLLCFSFEFLYGFTLTDLDTEIDFGTSLSVTIISSTLTLVIMVLISYLLPYKNHRENEKKSAFPYLFVGIISAILSLPTAILAGVYGGGGASAGSFMIFALGSSYCFRIHSQQTAVTVNDLIDSDSQKFKSKKAPVLFLRSFSSGKAHIAGPLSCAAFIPFHPAFYKRIMGISFDEFISESTRNLLGPLIALGDPDDYLPSHGSIKTYQRDDAWQEKVVEFIKHSSYIIILEGNTQGLIWELEYIRKNVAPQKVFILTYSKGFLIRGFISTANPRRNSWRQFSKVLERAGIKSLKDPGNGSVVSFTNDWNPVVIFRSAKKGSDYIEAIVDHLGKQ